MLLKYRFGNEQYSGFIRWTTDNGHSSIFRDIVGQLVESQRINLNHYQTLAVHLDELVDKMYGLIYTFTNEYRSVPYNPHFRRLLMEALSEIIEYANEIQAQGNSEHEAILSTLFTDVVDKLQGIADVYLEDNRYQGKHRNLRSKKEQPYEAIDESKFCYCFEDSLLQMSDISRLLDCLTEVQHRRLVKHIFLKYTIREIASHEEVGASTVHQSIAAALQKLRRKIDE